MYTPLRAHVCARLCVCVCVSSAPAKCRECTQLVKESGPTHLSTCTDNGPRLRAYIYTLINQLGPLISQSGNLMTSYSMVGYTTEGGGRRQSHKCEHTHVQTPTVAHLIPRYCAYCVLNTTAERRGFRNAFKHL